VPEVDAAGRALGDKIEIDKNEAPIVRRIFTARLVLLRELSFEQRWLRGHEDGVAVEVYVIPEGVLSIPRAAP
jgi:hypothetical protein